MELELGLKITRTGEESTSTDLRIAKDRTGPVFFSRETEKMFILTVHLKGFKREKIKIEINEEGTRIAISGEKPVQEMVLVRWKMYKKEREIVGFRKVFRIPNGVVLNRIKAKFDEEEAILTIFMPKSVKGLVGIGIEEVKEEEEQEIVGEKSETMPAETIAVTDETNLTQESPQLEPEQPKQEHYPIKETLINTPEIGVDYESEEIIPTTERIQESTANETSEPEREIVSEPTELESKPPDSPIRVEETPEEEAPELQEQQTIINQEFPEPEITEYEPKPQEEIKSEPEESMQQEEEITNENTTKEETQQKEEEAPVAAETSDEQQQHQRDEEINEIEEIESEVEEEEEEEIDRSVERIEEEIEERSRRSSSGFFGPCFFAGSALIGLLVVLVMKLLKKRKLKRKN